MCSRYIQTATFEELQKRFGFASSAVRIAPRYNIAPSQNIPAVIFEDAKKLALLRWGLIPAWAKDPGFGAKMTNARAETLAEKPSFKDSFRRRRCLIPADGFYEWKQIAGIRTKIPMRIAKKNGELFAFAGLWETWRGPAGGEIRSCTVVTKEANELMRPIHHRMPVILPREAEDLWLDPETSPAALNGLLKPCATDDLSAYQVSTFVNSPKNDEKRCIQGAGHEITDGISLV